ncbi:glycoside/pentoside/hexuronide:cation symporter, GPH family [Trichococcus ilyis]|uniref:Glycoside/pentoside/hexuronide:cation symporter, GPH family n=2 Tax=Trichococcus ilyis TaxID=640938 RepID=A0A143Z174_9LACT|nr:mfs/sugar transport protein [Trichococcus ilyis]SEJ92859.1 glycoside/pentoside/hexuronide:cation symporter, GPH family [Trichococcus ilyis]
MTFTVFPLTGLLKIVVCLVCYMAVGTLYTAISNAYSALVNVIAKDSQVRMNYSSARSVGSSIISMILSAVAMPMILFFGKSDTANATGFFWTTVVCSIAMIPMLMLCGWKCKEIVEVKSYGHAVKQKQSIGESIKLLGQNKMLLIVVLTTFFGAMATMLRMSMLAYYIIYVVGSYTMVAPIMTIMTFMQLAGSMALPIGTKLFGKKMYMLYNNFAQIICMVLLFILPVSNTFILIGLSAVIGFTNASANITFGMMSDCIEYGDWKFKVRNEGLSVSTLMLAVSAATALTGSIGVLLLSATGYVANATQSVSTINGIDVLVNIIPAGLTLLSVIVLLFYKIDNKMMDTISNDLEARNKLAIKGDL